MATERDRRHILVGKPPREEPYTPHPSGGKAKQPLAPAGGRPAPGMALNPSFEEAVAAAPEEVEAGAAGDDDVGVGPAQVVDSLERALPPRRLVQLVQAHPRPWPDGPRDRGGGRRP